MYFHYTLTHASWVNMVECFFSILQNNENPRPFEWTKGPEKLQRIIDATREYQAAQPRKRRRDTIKN